MKEHGEEYACAGHSSTHRSSQPTRTFGEGVDEGKKKERDEFDDIRIGNAFDFPGIFCCMQSSVAAFLVLNQRAILHPIIPVFENSRCGAMKLARIL